MSQKKRGGARLSKPTKPTEKTAQDPQFPSDQENAEAVATDKKGLSKGAKIAIIVVAAVAVLILGILVWYKSWARLPELPDLPSIGEVTPDPVTGVIPSSPATSGRKDGVYTFLAVGRDTGGGGNTDTIMLASYDINNQKLSVLSIPRDTMVDPHHPDPNHRINAVWNLGLYYAEKGSKKKGIEYLKEAVGEMMGFTPDFYVIVNWEAFGRLVDAIGGVDFDVPREMKYKDPTQDLVIDQAAGFRHLSGSDAMQVIRWRHNNGYSQQYRDGDLGRIRTQQDLMKAIIKQCLQIKNVTKIQEFAEIFTDEVETDLTVGNLVAFAERAILGGLEMDNVTFTTMPYEGVYVKKASYLQAKPEELLALLNESFNPYKEDLTMDNLKIAQYSSSKGYYIYHSDGASKPVSSTKPSTTQPSDTAKPSAATPKPSGGSTSTPTPRPSTVASKPSTSPRPSHTAAPSEEPPAETEEPISSEGPTPEPPASETPTQEPPATHQEPTPQPPTAHPTPTPEPPTPDPNAPPQGIVYE